MNSVNQTLDPAVAHKLVELQKQLAVQLYSSVILGVGFGLLVLVTLLIAIRWNRTALGLMATYGFLTFWIPSAPTLYCSPLIFLGSIGGLVFLALTKRKSAVEVAPAGASS